MQTTSKSVEQMVEEQIRRWEMSRKEKPEAEKGVSIITISREPGCGGRLVAMQLGEKLGYEVYHKEVVHEMAKSANVSERLLHTLDEKGINSLEDWIASLVNDRHLWPDQYLKHLLHVVGSIGKHGKVVIVGRGANFVLPVETCLRVRLVASLKCRVKNVSAEFKVPMEEAEKHVLRTESDRRAFVRKYFYTNISEPSNYDLVINTENLGIDKTVLAIIGALGKA